MGEPDASYDPVHTVSVPALALPAKAAAAAIGLSERKLRELVAGNQVPHARIDKRLVFPVDELKHWLASKVTGGKE